MDNMHTKSHSHLLKVGSTGSRVRTVEKELKKLGYLAGAADGHFDSKTAKAVVAFKQDHGWKSPHGVVGGPMTRSLARAADAFTPSNGSKGGKTPSQLKGATYNVERDRNPNQIRQWLGHFAKSNNLDFVQVQEINGYHQALNSIPGYHLVTFPKAKDHGESGILVRDGLETKNAASIQGEGGGWTTVRGGHAPPRAATALQLAGWLELASVHQPPSVNWKNGHMVGPQKRIDTYRSLSEKLVAFGKKQLARNPNEALLIGGDWNEQSSTNGKWSPGWIAKQLGMKKNRGGHIDWDLSRGCQVSHVKVGPTGGSDHHIVTFTVSQPKHGKR